MEESKEIWSRDHKNMNNNINNNTNNNEKKHTSYNKRKNINKKHGQQ